MFVKWWNFNIWKLKNYKKKWVFGLQLWSILLFGFGFLVFSISFFFLLEVFQVIIIWGSLFNRRHGRHRYFCGPWSAFQKNHQTTGKVLHSVLLFRTSIIYLHSSCYLLLLFFFLEVFIFLIFYFCKEVILAWSAYFLWTLVRFPKRITKRLGWFYILCLLSPFFVLGTFYLQWWSPCEGEILLGPQCFFLCPHWLSVRGTAGSN